MGCRAIVALMRPLDCQVMQWEKMHPSRCGGPRLKKFAGRPQDYSPKARLLNFLGYKLPFDRHDWVVDRCGREVRYSIRISFRAALTTQLLSDGI